MNLDQKFDWKIQKLERARQASPRDVEMLLSLAEAYFQKGYYLGKGEEWFEHAIGCVDDALAAGGATARAYTLRANALYGKGAWADAEADYRSALGLEPRNALALVGLGNLEKRRRDFRMAREYFARAVDIEPRLWQAHYNMGKACMEEARSRDFVGTDALLDKAIFHMVSALRLAPVESFVPNIHKALGELFLQTQRYNEARRFMSRLTTHERYAPLAWWYLGLTSYSLGKYKSAIQYYRNFLRYEPGSAAAWAKIGLCYLELTELDKARQACQQALAISESNILALFTLGCTWLDEQDHTRAQECFQKVLDRAPDYFPAYVELVRTHLAARDFEWIGEQLKAQVAAFEAEDGFDGGRGSYQGPRGKGRRRIDVLLSQARELGGRSFPLLLAALAEAQTDSLRFQIYEELYGLCRQLKVEEITARLRTPLRFDLEELGAQVVALSAHLPQEVLMAAFHVDEDALKKLALERSARKDDINEYMKALERARAQVREYQGQILRALSLKGTEEAEHFLEEHLSSDDRALQLSAAVALIYYGNPRALALLDKEASRLAGPAGAALSSLVRSGWEKHHERTKVIHFQDLAGGRSRGGATLSLVRSPRGEEARPAAPTPQAPSLPSPAATCAVCEKGQREVPRLLAGSRLMICTSCLSEFWRDRDALRNRADASCSFCGKDASEVDTLYTRPLSQSRRAIHLCSGCLDLGMGVLEREEVDRFLSDLA